MTLFFNEFKTVLSRMYTFEKFVRFTVFSFGDFYVSCKVWFKEEAITSAGFSSSFGFGVLCQVTFWSKSCVIDH